MFAPQELVALRLDCAHRGLPLAGQRLLTLTTMDVPAFETLLPLQSVLDVMRQQVLHAGPAPAPGPTPKRAWEAATL